MPAQRVEQSLDGDRRRGSHAEGVPDPFARKDVEYHVAVGPRRPRGDVRYVRPQISYGLDAFTLRDPCFTASFLVMNGAIRPVFRHIRCTCLRLTRVPVFLDTAAASLRVPYAGRSTLIFLTARDPVVKGDLFLPWNLRIVQHVLGRAYV